MLKYFRGFRLCCSVHSAAKVESYLFFFKTYRRELFSEWAKTLNEYEVGTPAYRVYKQTLFD